MIISFSPEEKVTAEQAMYVLEHFAKDVLGDDYEVVYAVHTDREHMHGHLIWNSVSMTTGKKYNSPKSNWKNHLQPITNKYCDELGLSIMPAEYSKNPKNISRDKWEKEMSMKEIILRDVLKYYDKNMSKIDVDFKLSNLMELQCIKANHLKNDHCLTDAFNKIINYRYDNIFQKEKKEVTKELEKINHDLTENITQNHTDVIRNVLKECYHVYIRINRKMRKRNRKTGQTNAGSSIYIDYKRGKKECI